MRFIRAFLLSIFILPFHATNGLAQSLSDYEQICRNGEARICYSLGHLYRRGELGDNTIEPNPEKARKFYKLSCDLEYGEGIGCSLLGLMLIRGEGGSKNEQMAERMFDEGCYQGNGFGCYFSGLQRIVGREDGYEEWLVSNYFFSRSCIIGYKKGCEKADEPDSAYVGSSGPKNQLQDENKCRQGNAEICYSIAYRYSHGIGVQSDDAKAASFYSVGCEAGFGPSCTSAGATNAWLLRKLDQGFEYFSKGCDLGHGLGCANVAGMYRRGNGVQKSEALASEYLSRACNLGHSQSCD